ncbi:uncharacterized protein BKCO1_6000215 [Diplodia corticola]|uniref:Uncharacterized protein n=1 Tax=Diplodia corticola TaxID=236234 RepID=A0A1J9RAX5_9PEZI|nr:uncharacterized protein BKCO1_6000215 [Diplodia corticola]OJD37704.1 hypothetical protein BKCO1_6000215 [Diplodia corticola]
MRPKQHEPTRRGTGTGTMNNKKKKSHPHHHHKKPPKSILKNRKPPTPTTSAAAADADAPIPPTEADLPPAEADPPPAAAAADNEPPSHDRNSADAHSPPPTIATNSKRACQLLLRIKADQSPVAAFFGIARLKGAAAELHRLLAEEGERVRTGERDVRRLLRLRGGGVGEINKGGGGGVREWEWLERDEEVLGKTVQTKTEFVSINSQFNKIVVTPLEKSFRNHGRSQPDYGHLRRQAELLLEQAREARNALKTAVKDAKRRNSSASEDVEPDPLQFKIPVQHRKRRKRHSQGRKKL